MSSLHRTQVARFKPTFTVATIELNGMVGTDYVWTDDSTNDELYVIDVIHPGKDRQDNFRSRVNPFGFSSKLRESPLA